MSRIFVALDTETTSIGSDSNDVIEIAAIKFRDDRVLDTWQTLVKPASSITYKVTQLTGITQKDVEHAPLIHSVAHQLLRFVGDLPVVGHSIEFDLQALAAGGVKLPGPSYDTFELATLMLPEVQVYTLIGVAAALGIPHPDAHRAMADAEVTRQVFTALLRKIAEMEPAALAEISRATAHSNWSLRGLFQDAERELVRNTFVSTGPSIADVLLAKGAKTDELELAILHPPVLPPPLEITPAAVMVDTQAIAAELSPGGAVQRSNPTYEFRPAQVQMAEAVAEALNEGKHLIVEAGTGTGKSMAYLLPAIEFAVRNGQRVVISTNTINLQEQLFHKDIPALQTALQSRYLQQPSNGKGKKRRHDADEEAFTAALVKGRSNYLCLRRWANFRKGGSLSREEIKVLVKGLVWLPQTNTGDRSELLLIGGENAVWERVCAQAEACDLSRCNALTNGLCFLHRARGKAEGAHIVVVNHALLLADLATDNALLPYYDHLIIDEAHNLEDQATEQLGYKVDEVMVADHLNKISRRHAGRNGTADTYSGLAITLREVAQMFKDKAKLIESNATRMQERCAEATIITRGLFDRLNHFFSTHGGEGGQYDNRMRLTAEVRHQPAWHEVASAWLSLTARLAGIQDALDTLLSLVSGAGLDENTLTEMKLAAQANRDLGKRLETVINDGNAEEIYWLQCSVKDAAISLHAAPLHVGNILAEKLFGQKQTVVLSSATLSTNGNFTYIKERLGLNDYAPDELLLASPFDYQRAALVYLPTDMPEPNQQGYQKAVEQAILDLCLATSGRALVLFTSHSALKQTYKAVQRKLEAQDIMLLGHNLDGNRRQLLDRFRKNPRSVLFGTNSFWEGIDVVGDSLSLLVIAKLPFSVPNDPVFAARCEGFDDSFIEYSVPQAVLKLKQGFGRLIRSKSDRGVVAMLDRRLLTKGYGANFLNSLPAAKIERGSSANMAARAKAWLSDGVAD